MTTFFLICGFLIFGALGVYILIVLINEVWGE